MLSTIGIGVFFLLVTVVMIGVSLLMTRSWYGARVARRQSVLLIALLGGMGLISLALYLALRDTWRLQVLDAFQFGLALVAMAILATAMVRRRLAGSVLLDLGPLPGHQISLLAGGMYLIVVVITLFQPGTDNEFSLNTGAKVLFWLSFGVLFLFHGTSHVQIREAGIFYQQQFIPWHKIQSYHWEPDRPTTLTLHVQAWLPFAAQHHISVREQDRAALDTILVQRVALPTQQSYTSV
ncbi:MAG: hypothetical protein JOZ51_21375 [Chloroflexi bacterium]|nr:hypothetical protein [Chloroflexota bacterium]